MAVQNCPSLHGEPFGSFPVQLFCDSLQQSVQSLSERLQLQGSPEWLLQLPLLQVSEPLQYTLSSQDQLGYGVQV